MSTGIVSCDWSNWINDHAPVPVANPDIAGIGVLIAFVATAYMTLLLVLIYYAAGCVDSQFLNDIDRSLLRVLWRITRPKASARRKSTLRRAILMFSDQQLVTGIALLVAGFAQLRGGLDAYHWQILVYLVWFSSVTHLTTLTLLRQYFRDNPAIRSWRAVFMLATVIMLGVALSPSANSLWLSDTGNGSDRLAGVPALCYFNQLKPGYTPYFKDRSDPEFLMIVSILILFFGYATRLIRLSRRATDFAEYWIKFAPGIIWKKWTAYFNRKSTSRLSRFFWRISYLSMETIRVCLYAYCEVYESMLAEILWLVLALAWGSTRLLTTWIRSENTDNSMLSGEQSWGFGQLLPLMLLALPIFSVGESFYEARFIARDCPEDIGNETVLDLGSELPTLRIGQWSKRLRPRPTFSENDQASAQVETELSNLEHTASSGSRNPRIVQGNDICLEQNTSVHSRHSTTIAPPYLRDYYQYEWFYLLIALIFLLVLETAGYIIGRKINIINQWARFLGGISYLFLSTGMFAGAFVILIDFHQPVGRFLERYAKLSHDVQYSLLHFATYILAIALVVSVAWVII